MLKVLTRAGLLACLLAASPALALDSIIVRTDHAQVLKLPPRTNTIIIGNPMIADVSVQKNGSMVVTGKSYGTTNLIAQDATGAVIGESIIKVEAPVDDVLAGAARARARDLFLHAAMPAHAQPGRRAAPLRGRQRPDDEPQYAGASSRTRRRAAHDAPKCELLRGIAR